MSFLTKIFPLSSFTSRNNPVNFGKIIAKWDINGKKYGPYSIDYILDSNWSRLPDVGRFENAIRWRKFTYFTDLIAQLLPTQDQLKYMNDNRIIHDNKTLTYKGAHCSGLLKPDTI